MNSALPRMVQPVNSEARLSLISGVLPIAWTTSLLNFIFKNTGCFVTADDPKVPPPGSQADRVARLLSGFREHHVTHVDISRQKSRFAICEIVFPQAPKTVVEARRRQVRPGRAEIASPDRERLGIILPENAFADNGNAEPFAERF